MSKDNYDQSLPEIKGISDANTQTPNLPIDIFLQEASDLEVWSKDDQEQLLQAGITQATFDTLTPRIGALRHAQSLWIRERYSKKEAAQEWEERQPAAMDLKNELEHGFRFAFRKRDDLLRKVQAIEEGTGYTDMIQDLSDLAVLGEANAPLLELVGMDLAKLEQAATTSNEMSELLATMNGERAENNSAKRTRDKAYTLLKQSVDELRQAGKFLFWKDEKRLKGYKSKYYRGR